jgi:esterase/lipase
MGSAWSQGHDDGISLSVSLLKKVAMYLGLTLLVVLAVVAGLALVPVGTGDLEASPDPASSYEDAVARFEAVVEEEDGKVCGECGSRLFTHGEKTDTAVVFFHGLSNSPRQFVELSELLYEDGYNVLILRMPYHGLLTHDVKELSYITAGDLVGYADRSVDIGAGLGDKVVVAGLSGGGSVAAWVAQNRADVDKVMLIAPLIGIEQVPGFATDLFINLFARLPNMDVASSSEPEREHVYRGQATRGVAEYMLLAKAVRKEADKEPSDVRMIDIVINANDDQVNNGMTEKLAEKWSESGAEVRTHEFAKSLGLHHDVIDVTNVKEKRDISYPVIIEMIES